MVEQNRSSKNIWSSKSGRAKKFGRAKTVEQKHLVEQKWSSKKIGRAKSRANRPANLSCRTVRWGGSIEQNHNKTIVKSTFFFCSDEFAHECFQSILALRGTPFWVAVGCHLVSHPWGTILGLRGVPLWVCRGVPSWTTKGTD